MCATRWTSLYQCVNNFTQMLHSIISTIDQEIRDDSNLDSDSKYWKTLDNLCSYKFISFSYFPCDILGIINKFTLQLQSDSIDYGGFLSTFQVCLEEIKVNYVEKCNYGDNMRIFDEKMEKSSLIENFIIKQSDKIKNDSANLMKEYSKLLYDNLNERFSGNQLVNKPKIFVVETIRDVSEDDPAFYMVLMN